MAQLRMLGHLAHLHLEALGYVVDDCFTVLVFQRFKSDAVAFREARRPISARPEVAEIGFAFWLIAWHFGSRSGRVYARPFSADGWLRVVVAGMRLREFSTTHRIF